MDDRGVLKLDDPALAGRADGGMFGRLDTYLKKERVRLKVACGFSGSTCF
jgi:hypothetical protein